MLHQFRELCRQLCSILTFLMLFNCLLKYVSFWDTLYIIIGQEKPHMYDWPLKMCITQNIRGYIIEVLLYTHSRGNDKWFFLTQRRNMYVRAVSKCSWNHPEVKEIHNRNCIHVQINSSGSCGKSSDIIVYI